MIARILQCDNCHSTAGARPASSGGEARKAHYAGTIRRVILLRWRRPPSARTQVIARDLCGQCRPQAKTLADAHEARLLAQEPALTIIHTT